MTITATEETLTDTPETPGMQLARIREQKGYTQEYVAGKLHLRVKVIELLETDQYDQMPEPVFIKGYLRAYAKLLGLPADPLLAVFNNLYTSERKSEKTLWQGKREFNKGEPIVRWITILLSMIVIVAVGIWWQKNKDHHSSPLTQGSTSELTRERELAGARLTDLSKLRSILPTPNRLPLSPLEKNGD